MKDFFGFELAVGDTVAITEPNYRNFVRGRIEKINAKMLRVSYTSGSVCHETNKYPKDVVKMVANPEQWAMIKFTAGISGEVNDDSSNN